MTGFVASTHPGYSACMFTWFHLVRRKPTLGPGWYRKAVKTQHSWFWLLKVWSLKWTASAFWGRWGSLQNLRSWIRICSLAKFQRDGLHVHMDVERKHWEVPCVIQELFGWIICFWSEHMPFRLMLELNRCPWWKQTAFVLGPQAKDRSVNCMSELDSRWRQGRWVTKWPDEWQNKS